MIDVMSTGYGLGRTPQEYERLRAQARAWEAVTGRLLDRVGVPVGASVLDAGCGPGETMRLLAERVGPSGSVVGVDADAVLGAAAQEMLHGLGHGRCRVVAAEIRGDEPVAGGPYDVVFARLLLFHLPQRVAVLGRLWEAVAAGGVLVVQDYDLSVVGTAPPVPAVEAVNRLMVEAFEALGCDVRVGTRLPALFAEAGVGVPDDSDVSGLVAPLGPARMFLEQVVRGVLPAAVARGAVDVVRAERVLTGLAAEAERSPGLPVLAPLLVGAWKRRPVGG
ncbi:hypothetical protein Acsp01_33910 [Actinoplanes sp. NBRC 101535]|nr:hypothetical protein Acsp01_33910 [Actinoplanes sp. NBRC 101535]